MLQTRASLPMLWIFNLFSLISCTLLFLVNLKTLVLTHLYFYFHTLPFPHPLSSLSSGGEGYQVHCGFGSHEGLHFAAKAREWWS